MRDFLLLFFFIALGATLDLSLLGAHVSGAIIFSVFVLVGNPLIVLAIMGVLGYRRRTGFLAGLTVAQISEFSLIFVSMGVALGHVEANALGLVTLVGLVTIAASTYMITYSHEIFAVLGPWLGVFERKDTPREPSDSQGSANEVFPVIVFGLGRFGTAVGMRLERRGIRVLGADFNPLAVRRWRALGMAAKFGDATDPEFVSDLPLQQARWLVCTVPVHPTGLSHEDTRTTLIQLTRGAGFRGRIAVTSHHPDDTAELLTSGADVVLEPFQDAADRAVELLGGAPAEERTDFPTLASEETTPTRMPPAGVVRPNADGASPR